MLAIFQKENFPKLKELIWLMLPLLGTQMATMGMGFFDTCMSGQAGNVHLAGVAMGSNIWAPLSTGFYGILMAATPLAANYLGAGEQRQIARVIRHGMLLGFLFALLIIGSGVFWLPWVLQEMGLEPEVYRIAWGYCGGVALGVVAFFLTTPLRSLVDTLGHTDLSMKLYLVALPLNAALNYVLIFGKLGLPALGGIGAGVATGITYWLELGLFIFVVQHYAPFKKYQVCRLEAFDKQLLREYLRLGLPLGFSIFLEVAIFCIVAFFMTKYGTQIIAAHQAAMNLAALVYMIPLSFSMALTIAVGVAYGAKKYEECRKVSALGIEMSVLLALIYLVLEYSGRGFIASVYSSDAEVQSLIQKFIIFAIIWQCGDTVAAPCQGILRGYKDVNATFWASVLAYWVICLPVGLALDYLGTALGPFSYWASLDLGVGCSALAMVGRLLWFQKRLSVKKVEKC